MKKLICKTAAISAVSVLISGVTMAHEAGDILLRMGATSVVPDESTSVITTVSTGPLANTSAGVSNDAQLGLNLVYMLTDNWGLEVLAATPFDHDLDAKGLAAYGFSTTDLGRSKQLPPTVTANYFFGGAGTTIHPYVGVGINYTAFFDKSLTAQAQSELGASNLEVDDSVGLALRAGVDIDLNSNWMLNASVWNIDIDTDVTFNSALGNAHVSAELDPWVYMVSLGYKF